MVHFKILPVKALMVTAILVTNIHTYEVKGKLPDLSTIVDFLQKLVKPYVARTINESPVFRTDTQTSIEKFIDKKVDELLPFLQDFDDGSIEKEESSNITLDGDDETTIIEFLPPAGKKKKLRNNIPKDSLKADIEKYKKMRKKIKKALLKESVSEKTQQMVTKTLDKMIAELIGNQCPGNDFPNGTRLRNDTGLEKTTLIARTWNKQWLKFKKLYMRSMGPKGKESKKANFPGIKLYKFFEQFHDFLSHIVDDTEKISDRYKIVCQFIERGEGNDDTLRKGGKVTCQNFKLCSGELRSFLADLYTSLNNTAVSTFRNYASMYIRDVNTDNSEEKQAVVMTVNEISDIVEHKIEIVFKNETKFLKLDAMKGKDSNVRGIRRYIHKMIENSNKSIKDNLAQDLQTLGSTQVSISKDLNVNLDLDLKNLEDSLKDSICKSFLSCNGKSIRRFNGGFLEDYNRNSVYVKVQMNLDDEIKNQVLSRLEHKTQMRNMEVHETKSKHDKHKSKKKSKSKKYNGNDYSKGKTERLTMKVIEPDTARKHLDTGVTRTTLETSTSPNVSVTKAFVLTSTTTIVDFVGTKATTVNATREIFNKTQGI